MCRLLPAWAQLRAALGTPCTVHKPSVITVIWPGSRTAILFGGEQSPHLLSIVLQCKTTFIQMKKMRMYLSLEHMLILNIFASAGLSKMFYLKEGLGKCVFFLKSERKIKNFPVLCHLLLGSVSALSRQLIQMLRSHQGKDYRKLEIVSLDDSSS